MQIAFRLRATGEGAVVVVVIIFTPFFVAVVVFVNVSVDIRPIREVTFRLRLKGERIVVDVVALLALVTGIAMEI